MPLDVTRPARATAAREGSPGEVAARTVRRERPLQISSKVV